MSETNTLILSGSGYELSIAPEAEALKAELLKDSALIIEVRDPAAAAAASNQIKKLAAMRNAVEKSRKIVKEPVLTVGKDIDNKATAFVAEIVTEEKRLSTAVGNYAAEVEAARQKLLREMEAKRREEEAERQRIELERIKAEEQRIAAERAAEEAKRKANEAFLAEEDDSKAEEASRIAAEHAATAKAESDRIAAQQEAARQQAALPVFVPQSTSGVKFEWDFEVTDVHAVYAFCSSLVDLSIKRSDTLAMIKQLAANGEHPCIPGLTIEKRAKVSTR